MTSLCLITLDRYDITKRVLETNLKRANAPYELLVVDNGSSDPRVFDLIESYNPAFFHKAGKNLGVACAQNIMLNESTGDYLMLFGNDIIIESPNWLSTLVAANKAIPNSGLSGIHCVETLHPLQYINGVQVHPGWNVFGDMFFNREVFKQVGYMNEAYAPYGLEDSDYTYRINKLGFINYYVAGLKSTHIAPDVGLDTEYRKTKDKSLQKNLSLFGEFTQRYDETKNYYISYEPEYTINQKQFFEP